RGESRQGHSRRLPPTALACAAEAGLDIQRCGEPPPLLAAALGVIEQLAEALVPVGTIGDAAVLTHLMGADAEQPVRLGVGATVLVAGDPARAARAFDRVLLEADDLVAPALDHRPLRHLAVGAERGRVLVLAIPALLPAEIALGGAAIAQLDHAEVERPARVLLGDKVVEGGKAFGGEPAADAALILE